jgi:hypothetical protein
MGIRNSVLTGGNVQAVAPRGGHVGEIAILPVRMRTLARATPFVLFVLFILLSTAARIGAAATPMTIYDDALRNEFEDWSWASHDLNQSVIVHSGTHAVSMIPVSWQGLYFHRGGGVDVEENGTLDLWVHGGTAGHQQIRLYLYANNQPIANAELEGFIQGGAIPAGQWALATIPFSALGVTSGVIDGIVLQADASGAQPTVYFDDLVLQATGGPPQPVQVVVDPGADRRPISPLIYGVNFGNAEEFGSAPYPLRRWGGNSTTRYNWIKDATNHASDWFFINLPESGADSTGLPNNSSADRWISETLLAGTQSVITVPTIGWVARDRVKRWGFSVAKYGAQQQTECTATGWPSWCEPDAGNGVRPDGSPVTGNDPHDTSIEVGPAFVASWVQHIVGRVGPAGAGGVGYYALDNEPMLWNDTQRDIHPSPATLDELWTRTRDYAEAVHSADPTAEILGPASWGWCEYFYSAADGCSPGADMAAHDGLPLLEWYLMKNRERELQTGRRPVDVLDIHYYPQTSGVALSDDESAVVSAARLRSVRSLYDPAYTDESWIDQPIRLIPRMKDWIAARCPGMKLAITEYNWGGDQGLSSALAQAEVLAVFGREGVDLATRWVAPESPSRVLQAFRLFLDYDGAGSSLAGESIRASSSDIDDVGAYAILTAEDQVALLLFNKATSTRIVHASIVGGGSGPAGLYRFDAAMDLGSAGQIAVNQGIFSIDLPARSATLALMPPESSSVPPGDADASTIAVSARPSPFRSDLDLSFPTASLGSSLLAEPSSIRVFDASGRLIRRLDCTGAMTEGRAAVRWDGMDLSGNPVGSGVYFFELRAGRHRGSGRAIKIR